ncbi:probable 4-coumarate--CoA ligase 3 [Euwallacea similis]|uniref:probable 4-coumarate--CoA ligase 3 n=1 Tax=Euwallacea similis TaxID=1736056 RepID=UPI00344F5D66
MIFEDGVIRTPDLKFDEKCGGIGKVLFDSCKKYYNRIAVINTVTEEWDTYSDLLIKCMGTASALRKRGLQPQNIIALCSNKENINASIPLIAAQFLGCISFSVDPCHTVEECAEFFEQVPPKIVFTAGFQKEFLENKEQFLPIDIKDLNTTSMIHFSSGSTGTPKAICLSHYYLLALEFCQGFGATVVGPNDHQLNNQPMGSCYNKDASISFEEGFFKSGDLVYFDEDFCLHILDRIKNVLRWNNRFVFLYHVERMLLSYPAVNNAIVIGIPHKREGERMMGVVQLKEDANVVTEEELTNYVNQRVEDHKRLREGVTFVKSFPTTITGKVNRLKLKQMILQN